MQTTAARHTARQAAVAAINTLPVADVLTLRDVRHSSDNAEAIRAKLHPLPGVPSSTRKVRMLECLCDYERATENRPQVHDAILTALAAHARHAESFGAF